MKIRFRLDGRGFGRWWPFTAAVGGVLEEPRVIMVRALFLRLGFVVVGTLLLQY